MNTGPAVAKPPLVMPVIAPFTTDHLASLPASLTSVPSSIVATPLSCAVVSSMTAAGSAERASDRAS